jgi:preprotein translocase subunit SecG
MLLSILLTIHILVCVALIGVILLQRSEGGAFGTGGGAAGNFMTARGAGDLLTRTTAILAGLFFVLSLTLTLLSGHQRAENSAVSRMKIDNLDVKNLPVTPLPGAPAPGAPTTGAGGLQAPTPEVGRALPASPPNSTPNPSAIKTQPADPLANLSTNPTQPANR